MYLTRQKNAFSFIPIKVSINNNGYNKLTPKKVIEFESEKSYVKVKIKFLGLKKNLDFYKNTTDNSFELFMNIDVTTSYVIFSAISVCYGFITYNLLTTEPNKKLIGIAVLFPVLYLLRIFQSINIKPKGI